MRGCVRGKLGLFCEVCVLRALIPCGAPALRAATPLRLLEGAPPGAPTDGAPGPRHLGLGGGRLASPAVPNSSLPSTNPDPTPPLCVFGTGKGALKVALDCFLLPGSQDSGRCCTPVYSADALRRPTRVDAVAAVRLAPHRLRAFLSAGCRRLAASSALRLRRGFVASGPARRCCLLYTSPSPRDS